MKRCSAMPTRVPSRALAIVLLMVLVTLAACGTVSTSLCGLSTYAADIATDLEALLALDPEQVAEAGTPDNAAALEALDRLDQTATDAQAALDAASEDEVGAVPRRLFQAALDATGLATDALRSSIESGDPEAVSVAMGQVQIASDAIDAFVAAVGDTRIECPGASPSASADASAETSVAPSEVASAEPSAAPTPTAEPTPTEEPTPSPSPTATATPSPTATPTPSPSPTATPTPSPTPSASPTASPSPSPTASPSPSPTPSPSPSPTASPTPSASASAEPSGSASAEPTPAPSGSTSEDGGANLGWIAVLGLGALGALAYVLWARSRTPPPAGGAGGAAAAGAAGAGAAPPSEPLPHEDVPPAGPPAGGATG